MSRTSQPLIGITGHQLTGAVLAAPYGFHDAPFDGYFREYAEAVAHAGGVPVYLPHGVAALEVVAHLDGLLLSGGEDVDPRLYGAVPSPLTTQVTPARDHHELELFRAAFARGIPVLAVCRGQQLVNVALGGTLVEDLPIGFGESHASPAYPRAHRSHVVALTPGSIAHRILGDSVTVNSFHHQAVRDLGDGLVVAGRAPDGVVECIQHEDRPVLGVQWHPECFGHDPVFEWLVEASTDPSAPAHEPATAHKEKA